MEVELLDAAQMQKSLAGSHVCTFTASAPDPRAPRNLRLCGVIGQRSQVLESGLPLFKTPPKRDCWCERCRKEKWNDPS